MKKLFVFALLMGLLLLTSCFLGTEEGRNDKLSFNDIATGEYTDEELADMTFHKLMEAIRSHDEQKIVDMFSPAVQSNAELMQSASDMIEYMKGDVVSVSLAADGAVGADMTAQKGKRTKGLDSTFTVQTTSGTYHIAIYECIQNEIDNQKIGITAICIIDDAEWGEDYKYRIGGRPMQGIYIGWKEEIKNGLFG